MVAVGIDTIHGILDSVKTASIQAFAGTNQVSHPYNSRRLKWSKHHGWIETVDLFQFPNVVLTTASNVVGVVRDSAQAVRLPWSDIRSRLQKVDLSRRYAPGNEWITSRKTGFGSGWLTRQIVNHDSVISYQPFNADSGITWIKRTNYTWELHNTGSNPYATSTVTSSTFADTVYSGLLFLSTDGRMLPEVKTVNHFMGSIEATELIKPVYGISTFCTAGDFVLSVRNADEGDLAVSGVCWAHSFGPDYAANCLSVLTDFGVVREHREGSNGAPYLDFITSYLRLDTCVFGTRIVVAALSVESSEKISGLLPQLAPNPAHASTRVLHLPTGVHFIVVRDALGRPCLFLQTTDSSAELPTARLPSGLYLVEISGPTGRTTLKLQVLH